MIENLVFHCEKATHVLLSIILIEKDGLLLLIYLWLVYDHSFPKSFGLKSDLGFIVDIYQSFVPIMIEHVTCKHLKRQNFF